MAEQAVAQQVVCPKRVWTKQDILNLLNGPKGGLAAQRGVVALFKRQTEGEREGGVTVQKNNVGFSQAWASAGSSMAKWMTEYETDPSKMEWKRPIDGFIKIGGRQDPTKEGRWQKGGKWVTKQELCKQICEFHAQQLADIANGC